MADVRDKVRKKLRIDVAEKQTKAAVDATRKKLRIDVAENKLEAMLAKLKKKKKKKHGGPRTGR